MGLSDDERATLTDNWDAVTTRLTDLYPMVSAEDLGDGSDLDATAATIAERTEQSVEQVTECLRSVAAEQLAPPSEPEPGSSVTEPDDGVREDAEVNP
ncbi:MAG TPA: hypothetical protein VH482_27475 [Thermomicrobiales bacterium]